MYLTDEPSIEETFNENSKTYRKSNWFFDTPGVIRKDQIINHLTNEELLYTIPRRALWPRIFLLLPGSTLFLSGLGRLDFIGGTERVRIGVFASEKLSTLITSTAMADEIYAECFGTEILNVPRGDAQRLQEFPKLVRSEEKITVRNYSGSVACSAGGE